MDIGLLVEARLQLDEHGDLLAHLGGARERLRDRRGRAHAVERHLDREHRGIRRRLLHEAGDHVERVIRVMDQDVALADRAPDVGRALEGGDRVRRELPLLQARPIHRGIELGQVGEGGEALLFREVGGGQLELAHQRGQDVQGQIRVVLEPDRIAHLPLAQARLDGHHQVLGAPTRDLHLGVARDPDPM